MYFILVSPLSLGYGWASGDQRPRIFTPRHTIRFTVARMVVPLPTWRSGCAAVSPLRPNGCAMRPICAGRSRAHPYLRRGSSGSAPAASIPRNCCAGGCVAAVGYCRCRQTTGAAHHASKIREPTKPARSPQSAGPKGGSQQTLSAFLFISADRYPRTLEGRRFRHASKNFFIFCKLILNAGFCRLQIPVKSRGAFRCRRLLRKARA